MRLIFLIPFLFFLEQRSPSPVRVKSQPAPAHMAFIRGGNFWMGSDTATVQQLCTQRKLPFDFLSSELPLHRVVVADFYMDSFEVSNREYAAFLKVNPYWRKANIPDSLHNGHYLQDWQGDNYPEGKADEPVTNVCWYAAMAYAQWQGKRLPSEAEWEYAARAGHSGNIYPWGSSGIDSTKANYAGSHLKKPVAVSAYRPNDWGLYNMGGNVWEYCLDSWDPHFYSRSPLVNPVCGKDSLAFYLQTKNRKVIRGGSYGGDPVNLRVSFRDSHPPGGAQPFVGFRCVKDL